MVRAKIAFQSVTSLGAMGNDASWVTVVDVCRGSLVRARVWARGRSKVILLQEHMGNV